MSVTCNLSVAETVVPSMRFNTLEEWLKWQEGLHFTSIELGLDRCMTVAGRLGLLHPDYLVISVAGTNGKGSSVNMLRNILTSAGYNTGCYTSPHLVRYNERICINGVEVSDSLLCAAFERIDRARGNISLTYFEFGTLAALDIFQRADIDIAVLEVGLGGRLDAVNCLDAHVALITTIDIDHESWLGRDRETIAREKAGIMRGNSPAVYSDTEPPRSLLKHAAALGTKLHIAGRDYNHHIINHCWEWQSGDSVLSNLPRPSLYNARQMENAAGVLMVLHLLADKLTINARDILCGLQDFNMSGRFQIVAERPQIILDVAHNRQSMELLAQNLRGLPVPGQTHVVIGMLRDKNHPAIFNEIREVADFWHLVTLEGPRGTDSATLGQELTALGVTGRVSYYPAVADALKRAREMAGPPDRILVTGSFLTVGAAMQYLHFPH